MKQTRLNQNEVAKKSLNNKKNIYRLNNNIATFGYMCDNSCMERP